MINLFTLLAPVAFTLPVADEIHVEWSEPTVRVESAQLDPKLGPIAESGRGLREIPFGESRREIPSQNQVRIEQRVIVRISPRQPTARQSLAADLPRRPVSRRFEERKMEKCIPVEGIAGVQTGSGNRLLLYLRDRRLVSANLEKSCRARDFYSGFYLERNKDGKLCADRDKLQSRSGANCEIDRLRELVSVDD